MCRKRDGYEEKREGGGIVKRKKICVSEKENQPQVKKVLTYKDERPAQVPGQGIRRCGKEHTEMDSFKKAFIRTATRYAEYVEAKIIYTAEIKTMPLKLSGSKRGTVYAGQEPKVSERLCEEMRTLNAVVAAVEKMEETTLGETNLTETGLKEKGGYKLNGEV